MPSSHSEITAYVHEGDLAKIAAALTRLARREGRRPVDRPGRQSVRYVFDASDHWNVALLPGAPGWTVIHAQPWNLLGRVSGEEGTMRFVDLCTALGAEGFLVDVVDQGAHGEMIVETDGRGSSRLGGWYFAPDSADSRYHDLPLDEDAMQRPSFEQFADLESAEALASQGSLDMSICRAIAHEVGGDSGRQLWSSGEDFSGAWNDVQEAMGDGGPAPVPGAVILQFVK